MRSITSYYIIVFDRHFYLKCLCFPSKVCCVIIYCLCGTQKDLFTNDVHIAYSYTENISSFQAANMIKEHIKSTIKVIYAYLFCDYFSFLSLTAPVYNPLSMYKKSRVNILPNFYFYSPRRKLIHTGLE